MHKTSIERALTSAGFDEAPPGLEAAGAEAVALLAGVVGVAPLEEEAGGAEAEAEAAPVPAPGAESTSLGAGSFHAGLAGGGAGSRCCCCGA